MKYLYYFLIGVEMLHISKIQTLLKDSCTKCCKHTASKAALPKKKKFTNTVILPKTNFESWLNSSRRIEQDERTIRVRFLCFYIVNLCTLTLFGIYTKVTVTKCFIG